MELLPNSIEDFTSDNYWNNFFKNYARGENSAFEWYGNFEALKEFLLESLRNSGESELDNKRIMHVGCGNSNLPIDLFNEGFEDITNIDFSEDLIFKMKERNKSRQGLKWIFMDIEKNYKEYTYRQENKGKFDAIIDKGFLDAYLSDQINNPKNKSTDYLASSINLLAPKGKYILVTLGQEYVTKSLALALYNTNVEIIVRPLLNIKDSKFLPYYIEITKNIGTNKSDKLFFRIKGVETKEIRDSENYCIWTLSKKLKELSAAFWSDFLVGDYIPGNAREYYLNVKEYKVNFFITVYDSMNPSKDYRRTVGLLVPLGEEHDWIYSTYKGYEEISRQARCKRLIVISRFYSDQGNCFEINEKNLVDDISKYLSPLALKNSGKFPILTVDGEKLLKKKCIYKCNSKYCKEIFVYDVTDSNLEKRQMIFKSNPRLIQSEVTIYRKSTNNLELDYFYKPSNYYIGVTLLSSIIFDLNKHLKKEILILGLGGGILASILNRLYIKENVSITAVEIDENVKEIAINYFGLIEKDLNIVIGDAFEYIDSISKRSGTSFNYIIIDINSSQVNDSLMCPGALFLSINFIEKLCSILDHDGCIVYNVSCRDSEKRKKLFTDLSSQINKIENKKKDKEFMLQAIETGEDEVNELWLIKKETENNVTIVRNFIQEKGLFCSNKNINSNFFNQELWIKRFSRLK